MANNPIPILAVLFLLKSKNTGTGFRPPVMNTLELESPFSSDTWAQSCHRWHVTFQP